jgi:DNA invertase Pin-like site-specific DNA recombinase
MASVSHLNGSIPRELRDKYCGQEHATATFERKRFEQLLRDARKGIFDAVIVTDATRWSRDNAKSKQGLDILRQNGIRFFISTTEYDLFNPEQNFFLGMSAEIGEYQARTQAYKSLINRIERAKQGFPAAGSRPHARIWDKEKRIWDIDPEKHERVKRAARLFLAGEPLRSIARRDGWTYDNLRKTLRGQCGATWIQRFRSETFNIDEKIPTKVPRLLPEVTIERICERLELNRTIYHDTRRRKYLLSGMVFCGQCGYALVGQTTRGEFQYYRHQWTEDNVVGYKNDCRPFNAVPTPLIEKAVIAQVFSLMGDQPAMERAARDALPDSNKLDRLEEQRADYTKELRKVRKAKRHLFRMVEAGALVPEDVKTRMDAHKEREADLEEKLDKIKTRFANLPSGKEIAMKAQLMLAVHRSYLSSPHHFQQMTFKDKRQLLEAMFAGKGPNGERLGVFIRKMNNKKKPWKYEIRGLFFNDIGRAPMNEDEVKALMGVDHSDEGSGNTGNLGSGSDSSQSSGEFVVKLSGPHAFSDQLATAAHYLTVKPFFLAGNPYTL